MNKADIEEWLEHPNHALNRINIEAFRSLCKLALRGLEMGEPVAYHFAWRSGRNQLEWATDSVCQELLKEVKEGRARLIVRPLAYTDQGAKHD